MNIAQLYYFVKVAQTGQYTKAAEMLFVSQSALSSAIARLEEELGVELFERKGRSNHLTKAGNEFYAYASKALEALEEGQQALRKYATSKAKALRIGTIDSFQSPHLSELLDMFKNMSIVDTPIEITQGVTSTLVSGIDDGIFDVAFCAYPVEDTDIRFVPVLARSLAVVLSKEHPFVKLRRLRLADLSKQRIITYNALSQVGKRVNDLLLSEKMYPSIQAEDEAALISLVEIDNGAVGLVLSPMGVQLTENLIMIPLADTPHDFFPILLAYKTQKKRSSTEELFIRMAEQLFVSSQGKATS